MADRDLRNVRLAALVTNGFEQVEVLGSRTLLEERGAEVDVVSTRKTWVRAYDHNDWGDELAVDVHLSDADPRDYDALLLPGGMHSCEHLRLDVRAIAFVRSFVDAGKPVAAIGHGPWLLVEAGAASGRFMTSYRALATDIRNAGGMWADEPVIIDGNVLTSRSPDDLRAFIDALSQLIASGREFVATKPQTRAHLTPTGR